MTASKNSSSLLIFKSLSQPRVQSADVQLLAHVLCGGGPSEHLWREICRWPSLECHQGNSTEFGRYPDRKCTESGPTLGEWQQEKAGVWLSTARRCQGSVCCCFWQISNLKEKKEKKKKHMIIIKKLTWKQNYWFSTHKTENGIILVIFCTFEIQYLKSHKGKSFKASME